MSFSEEELQRHCETIIRSRRAQGKIVILCEGGNNEILKQKPRPLPTAYRQQEKIPDANFYKACIPTWWNKGKPKFFVCGDRENVIKTYFKLLKIHQQESNSSYIKVHKLFAIIDLDLQSPKKLKNYPISDTEKLFNTLYQIMVDALEDDENLKQNFKIATNRIAYIDDLDFTNLSSLKITFLKGFDNENNKEREYFIYALLGIHLIKQYWKDLKLETNETLNERFKEQLTLQIGQFYAQQPQNSQHHLPSFFNALLTRN